MGRKILLLIIIGFYIMTGVILINPQSAMAYRVPNITFIKYPEVGTLNISYSYFPPGGMTIFDKRPEISLKVEKTDKYLAFINLYLDKELVTYSNKNGVSYTPFQDLTTGEHHVIFDIHFSNNQYYKKVETYFTVAENNLSPSDVADGIVIPVGSKIVMEDGHTTNEIRAERRDESGIIQAGAELMVINKKIMVKNGTFISDKGKAVKMIAGREELGDIVQTPTLKTDLTVSLVINGNTIQTDVPPQLINGRTMVPLRVVAESMGLSVGFDTTSKIVSVRKGDINIKLEINDKAYKNEQEISLDVPATIIDGRTLVPVRFISEVFGANVSWDEKTKTVNIITTSNTY